MTSDISRALVTFTAEAEELMEEMEQALLDAVPSDELIEAEWVAVVFRGMHTIKGSAGLFGLDGIVNFCHKVESLLEKLRSEHLAANNEVIDILIQSNDVVKELVKHLEQPLPVLASSHRRAAEKLLDKLIGVESTSEEPFAEQGEEKQRLMSPNDAMTDRHDKPDSESFGNHEWHISFRPHASVFQDGLDPLSFIRYLNQIGTVTQIVTMGEALNRPSEFDPEACYLGFEIRLVGDVTQQQLVDAFEFTADDADLTFIPPHAECDVYCDLIEVLPEDNHILTRIFKELGAIEASELVECRSTTQTTEASALSPEREESTEQVTSGVSNGAGHKPKPAIHTSKTLRVEADKLDRLIDQVGEMVITGARTNLLAHETGNEGLIEAMAQLERLVENIRDSSLQLRMVQIGDTFNKFKRVVRDIASEMGKDVDLVIAGAETELDKTFVEKLSDPLTHLVRNAIDHGIESPEERLALGKQRMGVIKLNAYHDSGSIVMEITDDGKGLEPEKLLARARERGIVSTTASPSQRDVFQLIFEAGFSTKEEVSDLSGRGVGMDVVKRNIEMLRGNIELESQIGKGTKFIIRLPLTLSIIDGFMFRVSGSDYVIPLDNVVECLELNEVTTEQKMASCQFIDLRDEVLPFLRLSDWFGMPASSDFNQQALIVVQYGSFRAGLVVDALIGEYQTVIKPLGRVFEGLRGVSGATILGSGEVAIILDVFALIQTIINHSEKETGLSFSK